MVKQKVIFRDLGLMQYQAVWDFQEKLLQENLKKKSEARSLGSESAISNKEEIQSLLTTTHYLLFTEHHPVYTLGKSGNKENVLLPAEELKKRGIEFFHTNRGGDITFHGPGQVVVYPILDIEKFYTDIGKYLRNLEETIIRTMAEYGLVGDRSPGETGVWIDPAIPAKARKVCAIGVRCSRWITMHGFAFNVNTDLSYFNHIIPCGISNKQVTSLQKELGHVVDVHEVKEKIKKNFEIVFESELASEVFF